MENEEVKKPVTKKPRPKKEEEIVYNPLEGIEVNVANEIQEIQEVIEEIEPTIEQPVIEPPKVQKIETQPPKKVELTKEEKEQELINLAQQFQQKVMEVHSLTDREIYESYVSEGRPYLIYYQNRLVFDSTISDKKNLKFLEEGFQIHGRTYNYNGIRFKFKK